MPHKEFRRSFRYDGKREFIEADSEGELDAAVDVRKYELEHPPEKQITKRTTVEKWLEEYLKTYKHDYVTHKQYINLLSHARVITAAIGKIPLKDIRKHHCEKREGIP